MKLAHPIDHLSIDPTATWASGAFVVMRRIFSVAYIRAWRPWRTVSDVMATPAMLGPLGTSMFAAMGLPI